MGGGMLRKWFSKLIPPVGWLGDLFHRGEKPQEKKKPKAIKGSRAGRLAAHPPVKKKGGAGSAKSKESRSRRGQESPDN